MGEYSIILNFDPEIIPFYNSSNLKSQMDSHRIESNIARSMQSTGVGIHDFQGQHF